MSPRRAVRDARPTGSGRVDFRDVDALRGALRVTAITPGTWDTPEECARAVASAIAGGATCVQFRDKRALDPRLRRALAAAVVAACRGGGAMSIVNDDPALALDVGADGVHVGPRDAPVEEVLRHARDRLVVGGSAGSAERAVALYAAGVDYLGVGAIFDAAPSKPDASAPQGPSVLATLRARPELATLPLVAIGGITAALARSCIDAGADGVAVIREIFGAPDPRAAAGALRRAVDAAAG